MSFRSSAGRTCAVASAALVTASCTGKLDVNAPAAPSPSALYQPISAAASAGKVKNLLLGLPPTDAEIQAVAGDRGALKGLVAQWTQTPQYAQKLQSFFANAFQQSQAVQSDFEDQLGPTAIGRLDARLLANLRESFARTALALVQAGQPFTQVVTTRRFMLTPRLMALYAFLDAVQVNDGGGTSDLFQKANPGFKFTLTAQQGAIALSDSLDPASPHYLVFYAPQLATAYDPLCPQDPIVYSGASGQPSVTLAIFLMLQGSPAAFNVPTATGTAHRCQPPAFPAANVPLGIADTQQWQLIDVRAPTAGETPTPVFALAGFRAGHDLVLRTPRVGFFTTPSFLAEWNTNNSNQARVTLNQTLIVALGHAISPQNAALPPSIAPVDEAHAPQGSACFACHQSLDPLRQFFRQQYSYSFHLQATAAETSLPGSFGFRGVTAAGSTIFDLANLLAAHPDFAAAWTQKLCTWANSAPCDETDPEFLRVAKAFEGSNFSWSTLTVELLSSPLVSYAQETQTADEGEVFPVARRDHLCATLSNRLGLADVCGLDVNTKVLPRLAGVQLIASVLPSDQYSRGSEQAVLANDPSLFFRTGMENVCAALAGQLIDNGAAGRWTSGNAPAAIADFVHQLMGIAAASDAAPLSILQTHLQHARGAGLSASDALKSTFVLACLSPSIVGIGQ